MTKFLRFGLLLSALAATPAMAQSEAPIQIRIVVTTAGLDLGSVAGQRALDRRLSQAVIEACGGASDIDLTGSNEIRRCRAETKAAIAADRDRLVQLASRGANIVLAAR